MQSIVSYGYLKRDQLDQTSRGTNLDFYAGASGTYRPGSTIKLDFTQRVSNLKSTVVATDYESVDKNNSTTLGLTTASQINAWTSADATLLHLDIGHAVAGGPGTTPAPVPMTLPAIADIKNGVVNYATLIFDQAKIEDVTRHTDGGNVGFTDGHVKWFRVGWDATNLHTNTVYFPPAAQTSSNAIQDGSGPQGLGCAINGNQPQPGGDMCGYAATFHLN